MCVSQLVLGCVLVILAIWRMLLQVQVSSEIAKSGPLSDTICILFRDTKVKRKFQYLGFWDLGEKIHVIHIAGFH